MQRKYFPSLIFLILLLLAVLSQRSAEIPATAGWYTTVYPPKYIAQMILIGIALLFSVIGYAILAKMGAAVSNKIFIMHFLFTIPLVIGLFKPFGHIDMESISRPGNGDLNTTRDWIEYLIYSFFTMGQLLFLFYFINRMATKKQKLL